MRNNHVHVITILLLIATLIGVNSPVVHTSTLGSDGQSLCYNTTGVDIACPGTATISGTITDQSNGLPVVGAKITLDPEATTISDNNGAFNIGNLASVLYNITVTKAGYQTSLIRNVDLSATSSKNIVVILPTNGSITPKITTTILPEAKVGVNFSSRLLIAGGLAPYNSWSISAGNLPTGLSLDPATGIISGTATNTGSYSFTVIVWDSLHKTAEKALTLTVGNALAAPGDCDSNGIITIAEVQSAINMFLGLKPVDACVDSNADKIVSISEVQKVINGFLGL